MILYLLAPVFILGVGEAQAANTTGAVGTEETHKVERNHTLNVSTVENGITKPSNGTSGFYKEAERQIEEQLKNNPTSVITEDNEDFQKEEDKPQHQPCLQHNMTVFSQILCVDPFHDIMQEMGTEKWCVMEFIIRPYNEMTMCMESVSHFFSCYYPNQAIQDLFLSVHSSYFQNCTKEEVLLEDAPQWLVITLTLIPVSLIPILTYLVVWKSKIQE